MFTTSFLSIEILFAVGLLILWYNNHSKFLEEEEFLEKTFEAIGKVAQMQKGNQVYDKSFLSCYDFKSISNFNKLKKMMREQMKKKEVAANADFSDDEENDFDCDDDVVNYRMRRCINLLESNKDDPNALSVENLIQNSKTLIAPHRHWMRSLDESSHQILLIALKKRAVNNCTAVQTNHKSFRLVNNTDRFTFEDKEYAVGDIMRNYIRWESDQVIHYANCLTKNYGSKIWHEAVLNPK